MNTCWYTPDACRTSSCNGHGQCTSMIGVMKCECDWGYEGKNCEINKDRVSETTDGFWKRLKNSLINIEALAAIQTSAWTITTIMAKSLGKVYLSSGEDDPQETHQALRAVLLTFGSTSVLFFTDPYLFKISQATCRGFYILIHFCFLGAMCQWMLEGYNANQVVRCVHLNEWERDFRGQRALGIMTAPRMVIPLVVLALALALIFQTNWYQLPSTWTCLGVICNSTTSVYLAIIWIVIVLVISTAAFAESSVLLKHRRPLYNLKLRQRIERNEGMFDGWIVEKCRRNTVLCAVGVLLLSVTWLCHIMAADMRDERFLAWISLIVSAVYGIFTFCQGMYTDPACWSYIVWFAMQHFPARFAPSFDPITLWTREEVKEIQKLPKDEKLMMQTQKIPLNQRLFLHHKWNLQLDEKLNSSTPLDSAILLEILRGETQRLFSSSGTTFQKQQLQETFAEFVQNVLAHPPRDDLLGVKARSEAVTLCAETVDGRAKVTKFMLVPPIDVFEPEETISEEREKSEAAQRRIDNEYDKEIYKLTREEALAQNNFMNSAIKFR
uniref:EGF-like domain-containing protein n=1 Tax=Caenorhabditis japonica TaxID=281687 RepID=A0A8R1I701_CAEJA